MELYRDIWASRRQRSGFRDRVSQTGTVPDKAGRLVTLCLCDPAFSRFSRTLTCDGRTDGQTDRRRERHRAMASTVDA